MAPPLRPYIARGCAWSRRHRCDHYDRPANKADRFDTFWNSRSRIDPADRYQCFGIRI